MFTIFGGTHIKTTFFFFFQAHGQHKCCSIFKKKKTIKKQFGENVHVVNILRSCNFFFFWFCFASVLYVVACCPLSFSMRFSWFVVISFIGFTTIVLLFYFFIRIVLYCAKPKIQYHHELKTRLNKMFTSGKHMGFNLLT